MSNERPPDEGAMFFSGMKFAPDETMKQADLNKIVVQLFRRFFITAEGEPFPLKHEDKPMLCLVQFLVDLDMRFDEETFETLPDDIKKFFKVINRNGTEYRYGARKPRF